MVREVFYCYIVAFVFMFLYLHFLGVKNYYPSFHREYLPVDAAAIQAFLWALLGPVVWVLQEYVLGRSNAWTSLDSQIQGLILAGAVGTIAATLIAWRWMLPLWGLATAVALYLRLSRPKDSL